MSELKKIIFVDDEPNILNGLKRSLHSQRKQWQMVFVNSGQAALEQMVEIEFDALVTDMMMPGMDGATLLEKAKALQPNMVRIVLSGHSNEDMIFRAVANAHQYLSKPCDVELLKHKLHRALLLSDTIQSKSVKSAISGMDKLPVLPATYQKLQNLLNSLDASIPAVGAIIAQDISMSGQLLKLVNSAFFGLGRKIASPQQATAILGIDTIKSLVLSVGIFDQMKAPSGFKQGELWEHSFRVANLAKKIALASGDNVDKQVVEEVYLAGMMHDIGKLILAVNSPEIYEKQQLLMKADSSLDPYFLEQHLFQTCHAHVGAYLLGLWGLSSSLVEAVAFHHSPELIVNDEFSPLMAVYLAEFFIHEIEHPERNYKLDPDLITHCFTSEQLDEFRALSLSNNE